MTDNIPQPPPPSNETDGNLDLNKEKIYGIWDNIKAFLSELLDIRKDSDRNETIESVRKDISFQGHNAWILIFSIMVASIGLNANSTAVVIGAMLISPLMGPIVGMGLGTAINDDKMLRRSGINLIVMVGLSLTTATLYFLITPIKELNTELAARTEPNILDVLVAIFGGLALIVAKAKKGTISNAIAGVAIATALMPPLCTAGYGIATGQLSAFGGAMYLFCINAVFIALATFLVCKFLKFPMIKYANAAKRKRVSRIAGLIGVVVLAPSIWFFIQLYHQQQYQIEVKKFVAETIIQQGTRSSDEWNYEKKQLDIVLMGKEVPQALLDDWRNKFKQREKFADSKIEFYQGSSTILDTNDKDFVKLQEERINDFKLIQDKDVRIAALEGELRRLNKKYQELDVISEEAVLIFPELSQLSYAPNVTRDLVTMEYDTTQTYMVTFRDTSFTKMRKMDLINKMQDWLEYRMQTKKIEVKETDSSVKVKRDSLPKVKPVKLTQ